MLIGFRVLQGAAGGLLAPMMQLMMARHAGPHPNQPKTFDTVEYAGRDWKTTPAMLMGAATVNIPSISLSGGSGTLRIKLKQHTHGEGRNAMLAIFAAMRQIKNIFVFDEDIDIRNDRECEWAFGTRFQADTDMLTSPRVKEVIKRRNIQLISYTDLPPAGSAA